MKHNDTGRLSRTTVRTLAISALVLLVLAGLFYYWANPSDPGRFTRCAGPRRLLEPVDETRNTADGSDRVNWGVVAVVGAVSVLQKRIWINAVVPLFGISLLLWGIAAYVLMDHGSPESLCND